MQTLLFYTVFSILIGFSSIVSLSSMLLYPLTAFQKFIIFLYACFIVQIQLFSPRPFSFAALILFIALGTFLLIALFQKHKIVNLLCTVFNFCICIGVNYVLLALFSRFAIDKIFFREYPYIFCLYLIAQMILCYLISQSLYRIIYQYYYEKSIAGLEMPYARKFLLLFFWETGICCFILLLQILYSCYAGFAAHIIRYNTLLLLFLFVSICIVTMLFLRSSLKEQQLMQQLAQAEAMKDYTDRIEKLYLDIRSFKHDYINILSSFHSYINGHDYDGLEKYFNKEILPTGSKIASEDSIYGRLAYIKEPEIKSIIYAKIFHALKLNINVTTDIREKISDFPINIMDLVRILGILLDNAIEASASTDEKLLSISFYKVSENICIQICNSSPQIDNVDKLYQKGVSSKSDGRGFGLYETRKILNQYPNALLNTEYKDFIFSQKLILFFIQLPKISD